MGTEIEFDFADIIKEIGYAENVLDRTIKFKTSTKRANSLKIGPNSLDVVTDDDIDSKPSKHHDSFNKSHSNSSYQLEENSNSIDKPSKYSTLEEREELIRRLLNERELRLNNIRISGSDDYNDDTLFFASDELNATTNPIIISNNDINSIENALQDISYSQINPIKKFRKYRGSSVTSSSKKRFLKSRDDIANESKVAFDEIHSFQPKLFTDKNRSYSLSPKKSKNQNDRIDEMLNYYTKIIKNREKKKREEEKFQLSECTFTPKITNKANSLATSNLNAIDNSNVALRLHEDAIRRIHWQSWLQKHLELAKFKEYTFHPVINQIKKEKESEHIPIHERIPQLQKEKMLKLNNVKAEIEQSLSNHLSFSPVLTKRSQILASKHRSRSLSPKMMKTLDIGSRLFNHANVINHNKIKLSQKYENDDYKNSKVKKATKMSVNNNVLFKGDFNQRQSKYLEFIKNKINMRKEVIDSQTHNWFKPHLNKATDKIIKTHYPERLTEDMKDKVYRLSIVDSINKLNNTKLLSKEIFRNSTFQPEINKVSKIIAKSSSLDELVNNRKGKAKINQIRKSLESEFDKQCSFHPKITNYASENHVTTTDTDKLKSHYGWLECPIDNNNLTIPESKLIINLKQPEKMMKSINEYTKYKSELRNNHLIEKEIKELQECTFHPNIRPSLVLHKSTSKINEPVIVKGLSRHLELQNQTMKIKQLAKQREEEVFSVKNSSKHRDKLTNSILVEPFKLSDSKTYHADPKIA